MSISSPSRHAWRAMVKPVAIRCGTLSLALSIGLAGCASPRGAATVPGPTTVVASQALVLPAPGGPSIVSVIEERYPNAVRQEVILSTEAATPGQNLIEIRMFGPMEAAHGGEKTLPYRSLLAANIAREIRAAVPAVNMQISPLFLRNNYGPFGYAFGRSQSGDSCIYGWQQLRADESQRANLTKSGAIQIRLRLCENGASEKDLLSVMYGYTLTGGFASVVWNPYGNPRGADPEIGANGSPIYPRDTELSTETIPEARSSIIRKPKRESIAREAVDAQKDETAAKMIVDVPAPTGEDNSRPSVDSAVKNSVLVPEPGCDSNANAC